MELSAVGNHLADSEQELQRWLLSEFLGGLTTQYAYSMSYRGPARPCARRPAGAPLLDLPFADSLDILSALLPFERVFTEQRLWCPLGEVCIAYSNT